MEENKIKQLIENKIKSLDLIIKFDEERYEGVKGTLFGESIKQSLLKDVEKHSIERDCLRILLYDIENKINMESVENESNK